MALILLAGLKSLPTDILEAAAVDGATAVAAVPARHPADAAAGGLSRAHPAHDGRLPGVRHHFRHHQRRTGGRDQRLDDLCASSRASSSSTSASLPPIANLMIVCILVLAAAFIAVLRRAEERANALMSRALGLFVRRAAICAVLVSRVFAPVVWLISTAYKPATRHLQHSRRPSLFTPTLATISRASFAISTSAGSSKSSLVISLGSAALSLLIGVPAGYALARARQIRGPSARLFLSRRAHRPAGRDAAPVLHDDARHRPPRHMVGGDPPRHHAQQRLRRLDDVLLLSRRCRGRWRRRRSPTAARCSAASGASRCRLVKPGIGGERDLLHHVHLERFPLSPFLTQGRDQADLGRAAYRLRHQGHHLGNARRARPFLDHPDRGDRRSLLNRYFVQGLTRGVH